MTAQASAAAMVAGKKAKLRTDILWADRELQVRQRRFGVELYTHVAPMSSQANFWQGDDTTMDDVLMSVLRPALLETQREIAVLELRRVQQKEKINQAEVTRQAAFPKKAETFGEKVLNAGVAAGYAGNSAKLKAELVMTETQIKGHQEEFGIRMYKVFSELEDTKGWLPTDRHIRAMYDQTRRDLEQIELKRASKESELTGQATPASKSVSVNATPTTTTVQSHQQQPSGYEMNIGGAPPAPTTTTFGGSRGGFFSSPTPPTPTPTATTQPAYGVTTPSWAAPTTSAPPPSWIAPPTNTTFTYASPAPAFAPAAAADPFAPVGSGYTAPTAPPAPYDPFSLYAAAAPATAASNTYGTTRRPPPPPGSDLLDFHYND
jgi:hypothetical protein